MEVVCSINKVLISQYISRKLSGYHLDNERLFFFYPECTFMEMFFVMLISSQWMIVQRVK